MEPFVVVVGFAVMGGILAGYLTARVASLKVYAALVVLCVVATTAAFIWLQTRGPGDDIGGAIVVFSVLVPFTGCVVFSGMIALVARRIAGLRASDAPKMAHRE